MKRKKAPLLPWQCVVVDEGISRTFRENFDEGFATDDVVYAFRFEVSPVLAA